jgi:hypothetical protein
MFSEQKRHAVKAPAPFGGRTTMTTRGVRLDTGAIQQTLHNIEGNAGAFELLLDDGRMRKASHCAVVRSSESRRVYLVVHDNPSEFADWRGDMEIIGFDALEPRLRRRRRPSSALD